MGEMGHYLAALRDWGAGLERDTSLWDRVRLMGPVKVFLCQKNATGATLRFQPLLAHNFPT